MAALKNEIGNRFGRLLVIARVKSGNSRARWLCQCDCGGLIEREGSALRFAESGGTMQGCGCTHREACSRNGKKRTTHGLSVGKNKKLYDVWRQMMRRCYQESCKDFPAYGARGISVCAEWHEIDGFVSWAIRSGYQDGLTIERRDVNGGYTDENCMWMPNELQSKNTRRGIEISYEGRILLLSDWSRVMGIPYRTLVMRKNLGWSVERMLTEIPVIGKNQFSVMK